MPRTSSDGKRRLGALGLAALLSSLAACAKDSAAKDASDSFASGASAAWAYAFRGGAAAAPPPGTLGAPYAYCDDELAKHGIDVDAENAPALAKAKALVAAGLPAGPHAIVVPGYQPLDATEAAPGVHPIAEERLLWAAADLRGGVAPFVVVSGGNVHPDGTPYNEALEMKKALLARGVAEDRILVEPCARHSHTNLRNAGRLLLSLGLSRALVVTSANQSMYFSRPRTSSFDARCLQDFGYLVGVLQYVDERRTAFQPSGRTLERGPDPRDP